MFFEVFENGGQVIQITGGPQQPLTTSLGKLLVHRTEWLKFFAEHEDGLVKIHGHSMTRLTPDALERNILEMVVDPFAALERPRRPRKRRVQLPKAAQGELF